MVVLKKTKTTTTTITTTTTTTTSTTTITTTTTTTTTTTIHHYCYFCNLVANVGNQLLFKYWKGYSHWNSVSRYSVAGNSVTVSFKNYIMNRGNGVLLLWMFWKRLQQQHLLLLLLLLLWLLLLLLLQQQQQLLLLLLLYPKCWESVAFLYFHWKSVTSYSVAKNSVTVSSKNYIMNWGNGVLPDGFFFWKRHSSAYSGSQSVSVKKRERKKKFDNNEWHTLAAATAPLHSAQ